MSDYIVTSKRTKDSAYAACPSIFIIAYLLTIILAINSVKAQELHELEKVYVYQNQLLHLLKY